MKLSEELFEKSKEMVFSYPDEIKAIQNNRLTGTAFFPGGDGIYKQSKFIEKDSYPILILGKDYDNEYNFKIVKGLPNQSEMDNKNNTWVNLKKILDEVNPHQDVLSKCYFTNCIMGLRIDNSINTGPSKAFLLKNKKFLKENIEFFKEQLDSIKPNLIIGLGSQVPRFIGSFFEQELPNLNNIFSFKELDQTTYKNSIVLQYNKKDLTIIFITHPAMYYANVERRKGGIEFEKKMIYKAVTSALKKP
jgi:hypothetical protein